MPRDRLFDLHNVTLNFSPLFRSLCDGKWKTVSCTQQRYKCISICASLHRDSIVIKAFISQIYLPISVRGYVTKSEFPMYDKYIRKMSQINREKKSGKTNARQQQFMYLQVCICMFV